MFKLFDLALQPRINGTEGLYYRKNENTVSFDTYFNVIPVCKLKRYTTIKSLIFSQVAEICTEHGTLKMCDRISLEEIPDNAEMLYLKVKDNHKKISIYAEGEHRTVKAAIIICTFQREEQAKSNVNYLLRHIHESEYEIILVDNDSAIPSDYWNSKVTVLHNINNGGSGGFACGMRYAAEQKRFTHIILMDDDVIIDFIAIQKILGFLAFLKEEYIDLSVAGAMLYEDNPTIQFECGGYFSQKGMQQGYGYNYDLTDWHRIIENEKEKQINYGGWWLMCMPICYAAMGEYPAPFFIKYDDVEYALRCKLKIITLNGVGVWHENFGSKYNSVQEYFNTRNYLFLMKRQTPKFTSKKAYKTARYLLLEKLCRQQYKMAEAVILGYQDYLRGETYLNQIDYSKKLSELRKLNYKMLSEKELREIYDVSFDETLYEMCSSTIFRRYMQPLLYGHLIPKFMCRKLTITDVLSDRKEHYFGAGKTMHYAVHRKYGYITYKNTSRFLRLIFMFLETRKYYGKANDTKTNS